MSKKSKNTNQKGYNEESAKILGFDKSSKPKKESNGIIEIDINTNTVNKKRVCKHTQFECDVYMNSVKDIKSWIKQNKHKISKLTSIEIENKIAMIVSRNFYR